MPTEEVLRVRARKAPTAKWPLDLSVSFEVPPGVTILFGPSGSGKSTLLAIIAGLLPASEGRITLGSQVWLDSQTRTVLPVQRRQVSLVFQSLALFPHLSALANVEYGIDRASSRRDRGRRAGAMLERMGVGALAQRRPGSFSGGEAQRVALARAFACDPKVVLLDEAFSALEAPLRARLHSEVRALVAERGIPTLQVTHDRDEARTMGSRVILVKAGKVSAAGPIEEHLGARSDD